jgi:SAM-dependent methyltransferase
MQEKASNGVSRYVPPSEETWRGKGHSLFRRLQYDIWRRELNNFGLKRRDRTQPVIVDVGCGPGILLGCLENWFPDAHVIGIDASDELLAIAGARCRNVTLLRGDAGKIALESGSVDVMFAFHIIEHLDDPAAFFLEASRVLRDGGLLVIATPNAKGLGARLMGRKWVGYSDPTHIALNGPSFWRDILQTSGFEIVRDGTTGLTGIPILNRMPLGLIHWIPLFLFGYLPWSFGEAYICTAISRTVA